MRPPALLLDALVRHGVPDEWLVSATLTVNDQVGITLTDRFGSEIATIDGLRAAGGASGIWRRPIISQVALDERERTIAELVRQGATTSQIAHSLQLSDRTVTRIRALIRDKTTDPPDIAAGQSEIGVLGRPGLLRDLVRDSLLGLGSHVRRLGEGTSNSVQIMVLPSGRELDRIGNSRAVVIGSVPESIGLVGAIERGVTSVLPVTVSPSVLHEAVDRARSGRSMLIGETTNDLVNSLWSRPGARRRLTPREAEILSAIQSGESMKQTARRLGIAEKTVESLRQQTYRKLGVRSAFEARNADHLP
jgi:DNA-binding NarL/FixJ family response regulator